VRDPLTAPSRFAAGQPAASRVQLCAVGTQVVNGVNYALQVAVVDADAGADADACAAEGAARAALVHRSFAGVYTVLSLDGATTARA
jgi:hypothetical protein